MTPFPWTEALRFGLGVLKLSSHDFWRMTPRELAAAIEGARGGPVTLAPPTRDRLNQLIGAFPDQIHGAKDKNDAG